MRKCDKTFSRSFPTGKIMSGQEQFCFYVLTIILWLVISFGGWYFTDVNYFVFCHFLHSSYSEDKAIRDYFSSVMGEQERSVYDLAITTELMANQFSYTKEHNNVSEVFKNESAVCLTWAYIECVYLKSRGYQCYQLLEFSTRADDEPDHSVVCIELDGNYYISDPTKDVFMNAREYIIWHNLTNYWNKRIRSS